MLRSCNGSRQHFPRLLRARHVDRSASVLDRDRAARPAAATPCAMARLRSSGPLEADVVRAGRPADRAAFRTAKLRI